VVIQERKTIVLSWLSPLAQSTRGLLAELAENGMGPGVTGTGSETCQNARTRCPLTDRNCMLHEKKHAMTGSRRMREAWPGLRP